MVNNIDAGKKIQSLIDKIISARNDVASWRSEILQTDVWSPSTIQTIIGRILDIREAIECIDACIDETQLPAQFINEYPVIKRDTLDGVEHIERSIELKQIYDEHFINILKAVDDVEEFDELHDELADVEIAEVDSYYNQRIKGISRETFQIYKKLRIGAYKVFLELTGLQDEDYSIDINQTRMFCSGMLTGAMVQRVNDNAENVQNGYLKESRFYGLFRDDVVREPSLIKGIECLSTKANQCKILSDGRSVYTGVDMYPGDIIEICPTKRIDKTSLYTKDMRDIVFEVVPNEQYVIPFGYCQYYDLADEKHPANCDYNWDPNNEVIVIKAIQRLPKQVRLFLDILK